MLIKNVCLNCIGNNFIKTYIKQNKKNGKCAYCGNKSLIVSINNLASKIMTEINQKLIAANIYAIKGNYDYHSEVYETINILKKDVNPSYKEITTDLCDLIEVKYWADRYDYEDSPDEIYLMKWEKYSEKIKKIANQSDKEKKLRDNLAVICQFIVDNNFLESIAVGKNIYRARKCKFNNIPNNYMELGSPPSKSTKANRYTKSGESAFYGAFDDVTPICEILSDPSEFVTVALFRNTIPLNIINLYKFKEIDENKISLFDPDYFIKKFIIYFLIEICGKTAEEDELSYIPTQEMISFFRKEFKSKYSIDINGIVYPSTATNRNTANCVLFFDNSCFTDNIRDEDKPLKLILEETIHYPSNYWENTIRRKNKILFTFFEKNN